MSVRSDWRGILVVSGLAALTWAGIVVSSSHAERDGPVPPPALDEANDTTRVETVVLAGGCFWGMQGVFQHVEGVTSAVSGYAGGDRNTANYDAVSTGATGHAESVRITFDPQRISYGRILQIYFSVAHDPTQLNYQGPDRGTQYRSTIFPATQEQADISRAYIAQLDQAHMFHALLVTTIEIGREFYPAETYHQDFLTRHSTSPYIVSYDLPKIRALQRLFPDRYSADPVLVTPLSKPHSSM
jgi:peptide-methionine (S)-S-oxide reductase